MDRLTFEIYGEGIFVKKSDVETWFVKDGIIHTGDAVRKLAEYENLEEQGRLLELPYALNDTVYYLDDFTPFEEMPIEGRISGFRVTWCGTIVIHITTNFNDKRCLADRESDIDVIAEEFGKTVFLTREEAEAALKNMNINDTN